MSGIEESEYQELENAVEVYDSLSLIHLNQYHEVVRIRELPGLTEATWEYYEYNEIEGLKEQLLLKNALVKLKLAIKELIRNVRKQKANPPSS